MLKKLFFIHDKDEETRLKLKIMEKSGIPQEAIAYKDIYIHGNTNEYIHTMTIDDKTFGESRKEMVFIHGLTGSCICYHGLFRELRSHFKITCIDMPGMGW